MAGNPPSFFLALNLFAWLILVIFAVILQLGFPTLQYMTAEGNAFNDFYFDRLEDLSTYFPNTSAFGNATPIATALGAFYGLLPPTTGLVFFLVSAAAFTAILQTRVFPGSILLAITFSSFPFWFGVSRGNNDLLLLPLAFLYFYLLARNRVTSASVVLAFWAALEPIFAALLVINLAKRFWLSGMLFSTTSLLLWASPVLLGEKNLATYFSGFLFALRNYRDGYVIGDAGLLFSNSLWGPLKAAVDTAGAVAKADFSSILPPFYSNFFSFLLPLFLITVYLIMRQYEVSIETSFSLVLVGVMLLGPVTATYKLVLLIPVFLIFLEHRSRFAAGIVWLSALTQLPKSFPTLELSSGALLSIESIVNPVLLGVLLLLLLLDSTKTRKKVLAEA